MKKIFPICFVVFFIVVIFFSVGFYLCFGSKTYKNPKYYKKVKQEMIYQKYVNHFPDEIPANAKNISMYATLSNTESAENLFIKFSIDEDYIQDELKKNDFINKSDKIGTPQKIYFMPEVLKDFKKEDYTYYVINTEDNKNVYEKYFPYFDGIGIKKDKKEILYYHIVPD